MTTRKGRASVNGEVCQKDDRETQESVDATCLSREGIYYEVVVYVMLSKPQDIISATSNSAYEAVLDCIDAFLPKDRLSVGRLDIDTESLLLITSGGELVHRLFSLKHHVEKTYLVGLAQPLQGGDQKKSENGSIILDEGPVLPIHMETLEDTQIPPHIQKGRFHQVKRMSYTIGNEVVHLKRIVMGPLRLDETLASGEWRYLNEEGTTVLKSAA